MSISKETKGRLKYIVPILGMHYAQRDFERGGLDILRKEAVIHYNYVIIPTAAVYTSLALLYLLK